MHDGNILDQLMDMVEDAERNATTLAFGARRQPLSVKVSATYVYEFQPLEKVAGAA